MYMMVDLETASDLPNAAILAIGAVAFNEALVSEEFYVRVDGESHQAIGGHVSMSTFYWWLGQNEAARAEVRSESRVPIHNALQQLSAFFCRVEATQVWGNGADFDCVILQEAYRAAELECPWTFRHHRCFRQLKDLFPDITEMYIAGTRPGEHRVKHHALHDARWQAYRTIAMLGRLRNAQAAYTEKMGAVR